MSYTTNETLEEIMNVLKMKLPKLKEMLKKQIEVETLHGTVEMIESLLARYERGEIVEK